MQKEKEFVKSLLNMPEGLRVNITEGLKWDILKPLLLEEMKKDASLSFGLLGPELELTSDTVMSGKIWKEEK